MEVSDEMNQKQESVLPLLSWQTPIGQDLAIMLDLLDNAVTPAAVLIVVPRSRDRHVDVVP
jgi:hypothetical protein